jgi:hypothetical protein
VGGQHERSAAALRLADASPLAKLSVRADADGRFARALDVPFLRSRREDDVLIVGSGPGEWLLLARRHVRRLRERVQSRPATTSSRPSTSPTVAPSCG